MKLIKKGAEADIYDTSWQGSAAILKIRKPKNYRNSSLDTQIRRHRTIKESQMLCLAKSYGVSTPLVYFVNLKKSLILMQKIPGKLVRDLPNPQIIRLAVDIGKIVGRLHKNAIMHGDLTTSNFILYRGTVYIFDFGLANNTAKAQDHAVDLRLIKEILNSAHVKIMNPTWRNFLLGYKSMVGARQYSKIIKLVAEIESRGRYAQVV